MKLLENTLVREKVMIQPQKEHYHITELHFLKRYRDYGEFCSDFIEQNAYELFQKFKKRGWEFPKRLMDSINQRNPKILKEFCKNKTNKNLDELVELIAE